MKGMPFLVSILINIASAILSLLGIIKTVSDGNYQLTVVFIITLVIAIGVLVIAMFKVKEIVGKDKSNEQKTTSL